MQKNLGSTTSRGFLHPLLTSKQVDGKWLTAEEKYFLLLIRKQLSENKHIFALYLSTIQYMIPIPIIIAAFPIIFHIVLGWALMSAVLNGQKLTWAYERRLRMIAMPMALFCILAIIATYIFTADLGRWWLQITIALLWIGPYSMAWIILTNYKDKNRFRHKLLQLVLGFGFIATSFFFILASTFVALFAWIE